jgi:hypothetical protein
MPIMSGRDEHYLNCKFKKSIENSIDGKKLEKTPDFFSNYYLEDEYID